MAITRINTNSVMMKVLRARKTQAAAYKKVNERVQRAKEELLREFDESPVTRELIAGPDIEESEVMPGGYGNLFSFLGFEKDSQPTEPVRKLLENIHLNKRPKVTKTSLVFTVTVPSEEDLEQASPMVWENRSWIDAITHGIGTFSHYMFSLKESRFKNSRAGTAAQVEPNLRDTSAYFTGVGYVIGFLGNFKRRIAR